MARLGAANADSEESTAADAVQVDPLFVLTLDRLRCLADEGPNRTAPIDSPLGREVVNVLTEATIEDWIAALEGPPTW